MSNLPQRFFDMHPSTSSFFFVFFFVFFFFFFFFVFLFYVNPLGIFSPQQLTATAGRSHVRNKIRAPSVRIAAGGEPEGRSWLKQRPCGRW